MTLKNKQINWSQPLDLNGQPISNLGPPVDSTSAIRQEDLLETNVFKKAAVAATTPTDVSGASFSFDSGTGVLTISGLPSIGSLGAIDGVEPVVGDRILIKDQQNSLSPVTTYNGIWEVTGGDPTSLTLIRTEDGGPVSRLFGATLSVIRGSENGGKVFQCVSTESELSSGDIRFDSITVEADNILLNDSGFQVVVGPSVQDFAEAADQSLSLLTSQVGALSSTGVPPYRVVHNDQFSVDDSGWSVVLQGSPTISVVNESLDVSGTGVIVGNSVLDELGSISDSPHTIYESYVILPEAQATDGVTSDFEGGITLYATDGSGNLQSTGLTAKVKAVYDGANDADVEFVYGEVGSELSIPLGLKISQRSSFSLRIQLVADPTGSNYAAYMILDGSLKAVITGDYSILQLDAGTRLTLESTTDVSYSARFDNITSWVMPVSGGSSSVSLPAGWSNFRVDNDGYIRVEDDAGVTYEVQMVPVVSVLSTWTMTFDSGW